MTKNKQIYGVDISKDVFDVVDSNENHLQFSNDPKGFKALLKSLSLEGLVVMEATGYYHYRLAQFLYEQGIKVSVVNPLSVKRFIRMKLSKIRLINLMPGRSVNTPPLMKFRCILPKMRTRPSHFSYYV